jgi:predicted DNA-binding transcriptional regulator AlpA
MVGRPKNLNPHGERFLRLYLDPLLEVDEICAALGIGKSTFYNYERELGLPKVRVAFGCANDFPHKDIFRRGLRSSSEGYELQVVRELAQTAFVKRRRSPASRF